MSDPYEVKAAPVLFTQTKLELLLKECREHLDGELLMLLESYAIGGGLGKTRKQMRSEIDEEDALEHIEPLEGLISRIDQFLGRCAHDGLLHGGGEGELGVAKSDGRAAGWHRPMTDQYDHPHELVPMICDGESWYVDPPADPRDPDHRREGIFVCHNCARCSDGEKPCVHGNPNQCEFPHARND